MLNKILIIFSFILISCSSSEEIINHESNIPDEYICSNDNCYNKPEVMNCEGYVTTDLKCVFVDNYGCYWKPVCNYKIRMISRN
jgi:hypothetical protein